MFKIRGGHFFSQLPFFFAHKIPHLAGLIRDGLLGNFYQMTKSTYFKKRDLAQEKRVLETQILVEVVYGLISRDCKGMGICKISAVNSENHQRNTSLCGSSLAYLKKVEDNIIRFDFLRETISKEQFALRFSSGVFYMEEPFCFSSELLSLLGLEYVCIAAGVYSLYHTAQFVGLEFEGSYQFVVA